MSVQTKWLQHLKDPKEREEFKKLLLGNKKVLDKLKEIVYTMKMEGRHTDYASPSWAYLQAHQNGFNEALEAIATMLTIKEET